MTRAAGRSARLVRGVLRRSGGDHLADVLAGVTRAPASLGAAHPSADSGDDGRLKLGTEPFESRLGEGVVVRDLVQGPGLWTVHRLTHSSRHRTQSGTSLGVKQRREVKFDRKITVNRDRSS